MNASIHTLPIWKKNSTPAEWLSEVAAMALEHPERFARMALVYESQVDENGQVHTRWQSYGIPTNSDVMGQFETAKLEVFEYMKGRRT